MTRSRLDEGPGSSPALFFGGRLAFPASDAKSRHDRRVQSRNGAFYGRRKPANRCAPVRADLMRGHCCRSCACSIWPDCRPRPTCASSSPDPVTTRSGSRAASAVASIMIARMRQSAPEMSGSSVSEPFVNGMAKFACRHPRRGEPGRPISGSGTATPMRCRCSTGCLRPRSTRIVPALCRSMAQDGASWKRRFVSRSDNLALHRPRRCRPGADASAIASDMGALRRLDAGPRCSAAPTSTWTATLQPDDWHQPWAGLGPGTRYEAKAIKAGRTPSYLTAVRRAS